MLVVPWRGWWLPGLISVCLAVVPLLRRSLGLPRLHQKSCIGRLQVHGHWLAALGQFQPES